MTHYSQHGRPTAPGIQRPRGYPTSNVPDLPPLTRQIPQRPLQPPQRAAQCAPLIEQPQPPYYLNPHELRQAPREQPPAEWSNPARPFMPSKVGLWVAMAFFGFIIPMMMG